MKARILILIAVLAALVTPAALAAGPDATTVVRYLAPKAGKYQIELQNTSGAGAIDTFAWIPPSGLTLTRVDGAVGGTCRVAGNEILCSGPKRGIAAPICLCLPGGSLTVTFTARGYAPTFNGSYWTYYGIGGQTQITSMTPNGSTIPSTLAQVPDLPVCALGTQPSPDNQCVVE
jgi:hypothetical protein